MKLKNIYLTAALTLFSSSVLANPYISANIGNTDFEGVSSSSFSFAGGYKLNEQFAFEITYKDLGSFNEDAGNGVDVDIDVDGLGAYFVGKMPVTDKVDFFGKIGMVAWEIEGSAQGTPVSVVIDGTDLSYGLGASYAISDNTSLKFEMDRISAELEGESGNVDTLSVGISFSF